MLRSPNRNQIVGNFMRNGVYARAANLVAVLVLHRAADEVPVQCGFQFPRETVRGYIDGTKIEANANRYSFVWRKSTEKARAKLLAKIVSELPGVVASSGIKWHIPESVEIRHLKELRKKLCEKRETEGVVLIRGKGHHKTALQKALEKVSEWLGKLKQYARDLHICGDRTQSYI